MNISWSTSGGRSEYHHAMPSQNMRNGGHCHVIFLVLGRFGARVGPPVLVYNWQVLSNGEPQSGNFLHSSTARALHSTVTFWTCTEGRSYFHPCQAPVLRGSAYVRSLTRSGYIASMRSLPKFKFPEDWCSKREEDGHCVHSEPSHFWFITIHYPQ